MARCLAGPSGGNEDRAARLCPVGRLSSRRARLLCSALLQVLFFFFFASLVLQEQLLRDPTHSYTWLSPSLPLSAQGLPWGAEKGGGGLPESHWFLSLSPPGKGTFPCQRQGG